MRVRFYRSSFVPKPGHIFIFYSSGCGSFYHVVEEVDGPIEGLADAGNVLESLGATVVLVDLVDGEAGGGDGEARQHAQAHQDVEDPLDAAGRKWDRLNVSRDKETKKNQPWVETCSGSAVSLWESGRGGKNWS